MCMNISRGSVPVAAWRGNIRAHFMSSHGGIYKHTLVLGGAFSVPCAIFTTTTTTTATTTTTTITTTTTTTIATATTTATATTPFAKTSTTILSTLTTITSRPFVMGVRVCAALHGMRPARFGHRGQIPFLCCINVMGPSFIQGFLHSLQNNGELPPALVLLAQVLARLASRAGRTASPRRRAAPRH